MTYASPPATDTGSGRGWFIALGVVLFILGLVALFNAIDATLVTTVIVGWLLVIAGIANIVGVFMSSAGIGGACCRACSGSCSSSSASTSSPTRCREPSP